MDNSSRHMLDGVEEAIREVRTVLIYRPSDSPHLNPIEPYFGFYKAHLKRNEIRIQSDWHSVYLDALNVIHNIKYFCRYKITSAKTIITLDEYHKLVNID